MSPASAAAHTPPHRRILKVCKWIAITALLLPWAHLSAAPDYGGYRPHYQGYGVNTRGGRGGSVQRVTHLNDTTDVSSPNWNGSLRKALATPGARFVVFEVSGTINLVSTLVINNPFITIAGQTAPSPGITLRNGYIEIDTHDVVIQHIRVRPGPIATLPHGIHVRTDANNIVLDHVSVSWTVWTAIDLFAPDAPAIGIGDVTIIDSVVSEVLACTTANFLYPCSVSNPIPGQHPTSRALLFGDNNNNTTYNGGVTRVAMIRTLSAQNNDRHPAIQGNVNAFLINNLIYNPSLTPISAMHFSDAFNGGPMKVVAKGNLMIAGPTTPGNNGYLPQYWPEEGPVSMVKIDFSAAAGSQIYLEGNYNARQCGGTACLASPTAQWMLALDQASWQGKNVRAMTPAISLANLPLSSVMPYTAVEAYVLANAGARPADRDNVDTRVMQDVKNRTGRPVNDPNEVGGYPVLAQNHRALTVPSNPNTVVDAAGRTAIEAWLEQYARAVESPGGSIPTPTLAPPTNLRIVP